jgi:hypothetical protein
MVSGYPTHNRGFADEGPQMEKLMAGESNRTGF